MNYNFTKEEEINTFLERSKELQFKYDYEPITLDSFFEYVFLRGNDTDFPFEEENYSNYLRWRGGNNDYDAPVKYNALVCKAIKKDNKQTMQTSIILKDTLALEQARDADFCIMSPITYVGRSRKSINARYLYALAFDLDAVTQKNLRNLIDFGIMGYKYKEPNIIVNSGHGVHLYYLLKEPIPLYPDVVKALAKIKNKMTYLIWDPSKREQGTSSAEIQYQGIFQGFRVPGSKTKFGTIVQAFLHPEKHYYTIEELAEVKPFAMDCAKEIELVKNVLAKKPYKSSNLTLKLAKELYPSWYEKTILKGLKMPKKWQVKEDLYYWWKGKIANITRGHRYFSLLALTVYALKCNIPYKVVKKDCYDLIEFMNTIPKRAEERDDPFTKEDVEAALKAYEDSYITFPRNSIEYLTGIRIDANKRNRRTQEIHLKTARAIQDIVRPDWREGNGRKKGSVVSAEQSTKAQIIKQWREANPNGKKIDCERSTKISRKTIQKWWNS